MKQSKKAKNTQILYFKLTNKNKKGLIMSRHIKLLGVDACGKEHYLKFVDLDMAEELIELAKPGELELDMSTRGIMLW